MRKSKNRYFYHIFVSPAGRPGAITLLYGWKDNSMLTNCLAACADLSITVSEIQRNICEKNGINPLHSTPPLGGSRRNIGTPFGMEKLEWCCYQMLKKFQRYVYSFWRYPRTWQTDRQTPDDSKDRVYTSHRAVTIEHWKWRATGGANWFIELVTDCIIKLNINMQSSKGTKHARKLLTLQSVVCSQQRWQNSVLLVSARTDEEQCQTVCVCGLYWWMDFTRQRRPRRRQFPAIDTPGLLR